jgi:hypothetical protein
MRKMGMARGACRSRWANPPYTARVRIFPEIPCSSTANSLLHLCREFGGK